MSEPDRLRDEGPSEVRDLLRAAAPSRSMSAAERARTGRRVARYAAAAAVAGGASWIPAAALGAGLGVAAVVIAQLVPAGREPASPSAPPPAISATARAVVEAPIAPPPRVTAISSADRAPPRAPPIVPASASASGSAEAPAAAGADPLAAELALLERARGALGGNPAEALALAESHAARFPRGQLAMEREVLAVDALRRLGRAGEARARGEALLARARGSIYEERVKALLEGR